MVSWCSKQPLPIFILGLLVHRALHDAGPLYLHFRQRCTKALGRERAERMRQEGLARDPDEVLAEARAELAAG